MSYKHLAVCTKVCSIFCWVSGKLLVATAAAKAVSLARIGYRLDFRIDFFTPMTGQSSLNGFSALSPDEQLANPKTSKAKRKTRTYDSVES